MGIAAQGGSMSFVLSLCDRTGGMVRPWLEAGVRAITVDTQGQINPHPLRKHKECRVEVVALPVEAPLITFAFPPCTHLAGSGARWFKDKGLGKLIDALGLVEACRAICEASSAPYMIENPVGTLSTYWREPDYTFHPVHYRGYSPEPEDDDYTKKTCLWTGNGFVMPDRKPGEPTLGSMMHKLPPSDDRADIRSATPLGFAYAVFEANKHLLRERAAA
jgi:hypothetical protein